MNVLETHSINVTGLSINEKFVISMSNKEHIIIINTVLSKYIFNCLKK